MRIALFLATLAPLALLHACTDGDDDERVVGQGGLDAGSKNEGGGAEEDASSNDDGSADAKSESATESGAGPAKKIFVTSMQYIGNLGGLSGADGKCASRAFDAQLAGTFKAWLSTTGTDDAKTRLTHFAGPYVRIDGVVVANDWAGLASNTHLAPIDIDEKGQKVAAASPVWTNTLGDGASKSADQHCNGWIGGDKGAYGFVEAKDERWTNGGVGACDPQARLYCVEQ